MNHYLSYVLKNKTTFWGIIISKKVNLYVSISNIFQIFELNQPKWQKILIDTLTHLPIAIHLLLILSQKLHIILK